MPTAQMKRAMMGVKKSGWSQKKTTFAARPCNRGVKIHIAVDVLGFPYAACVTTANVSDKAGAIQMFSGPNYYLSTVETILADGTYTGEDLATTIHNLTGANIEVVKRSELHKFVVIPKRWIVERSFGWLDKCRLLWKSCQRYLENRLNVVKLAFLSVLLKRFWAGSNK
jgi:transposase